MTLITTKHPVARVRMLMMNTTSSTYVIVMPGMTWSIFIQVSNGSCSWCDPTLTSGISSEATSTLSFIITLRKHFR
jgi:hypothetical protein